MDISLPNQPIKINIAGVDLSFSRDLDSGFIIVESSAGAEKLTLPQFQVLIQALSGLQTLTSNAIRAGALKG